VKILLDENFPLALLRRLVKDGYEAEHIIPLGQRGASDRTIRIRLQSEDLLFLTQDQEFLDLPSTRSAVIVSQVSQNLPLEVRIESWARGVREYFSRRRREKLFEVYDDGRLDVWHDLPVGKKR